jgi:hypothetical protein
MYKTERRKSGHTRKLQSSDEREEWKRLCVTMTHSGGECEWITIA